MGVPDIRPAIVKMYMDCSQYKMLHHIQANYKMRHSICCIFIYKVG
jgi:hypothetical protein